MPAMNRSANVPATWTLLSLRPCGGHAGLRAAAARRGGRLLALSPWRIQTLADSQSRQALDQALTAETTIFTSPAAVAAAQHLCPRLATKLKQAVAVGAGSARALQRAGVAHVSQPHRMDSEGVLALPAVTAATTIGLVTAPGGRGLIASTLQASGHQLLRANVYQRSPLPLSALQLQRLQQQLGSSVLAVSSGEALQLLLSQLPATLLEQLRQQPLVAASERLADQARAADFTRVSRAEGPMPAQLAAAAAKAIACGNLPATGSASDAVTSHR